PGRQAPPRRGRGAAVARERPRRHRRPGRRRAAHGIRAGRGRGSLSVRAELLQLAAELVRTQTPFVTATVVWRKPPSSAQRGAAPLAPAGGPFPGGLGGACPRPTVVTEAPAALADGKPRLVALAPEPETAARPGVTVFPMTCHSGGSVEIYLEP